VKLGSAVGGEEEALAALGELLPAPPAGELWFGDDAAALSPPPAGSRLLVALDSVVAGVDADLSLTGLADLGWKAMAVNLSDIAAMGGAPAAALVGVVGLGGAELRQLYEGILSASRTYGCPVVGGDLSSGAEVVVTVAVWGSVEGRPVLRSGARPGDVIWVTGPLGAAAAGLRRLRELARGGGGPVPEALVAAHARPKPALTEGKLAKRLGATAMIDVSDGLAADLGRLASSSQVGFELDDVPVAPGATLADALGGGDDYALVFTLPAGADPVAAFEEEGVARPAKLGSCVPDPGRRCLRGSDLGASGWEHKF
jgi:thiamine-monophosphate kinase